MKTRAAKIALLAALPFLAAATCQPTLVQGTRHAAMGQAREIKRVAVAPFALAIGQSAAAEDAAQTTPERAAEIVAHQVAERLRGRGVEVIAPSDFARALRAAGMNPQRVKVAAAARIAAQEFGADAALFGALTRWVERRGTAGGVTRAAAVGFEATLRSAPAAQRLWNGAFAEQQKPLGENLLVTSQYPGGGTRWLTAEDLAGWGASQMADALPLQ